MGNVVQCCHNLVNYIRCKDAVEDGEAERSPLLSREGSECDSPTLLDDPDEDLSSDPALLTSSALEREHFLFPDIILSSSIGMDVPLVEPMVCLLVSEEVEEVMLPGGIVGEVREEALRRPDGQRDRVFTEVQTQTEAETQMGTGVYTQTEMLVHSSLAMENDEQHTDVSTQTKTETVKDKIAGFGAENESLSQMGVIQEEWLNTDLQTSSEIHTEVQMGDETVSVEEATVGNQVWTDLHVCELAQIPVQFERQMRCSLDTGKFTERLLGVECKETCIQDEMILLRGLKPTAAESETETTAVTEEHMGEKDAVKVQPNSGVVELNSVEQEECRDWTERSIPTQESSTEAEQQANPTQLTMPLLTEQDVNSVEQEDIQLREDAIESRQNIDLSEETEDNVRNEEESVFTGLCEEQNYQNVLQEKQNVDQTAPVFVQVQQDFISEEKHVASADLETNPFVEQSDQNIVYTERDVDGSNGNTVCTEHNVNQEHQKVIHTEHNPSLPEDVNVDHTNLNIVHFREQNDQNVVNKESNPVQTVEDTNIDLDIGHMEQTDADIVHKEHPSQTGLEVEHANPEICYLAHTDPGVIHTDENPSQTEVNVDQINLNIVHEEQSVHTEESPSQTEQEVEQTNQTMCHLEMTDLNTVHTEVDPSQTEENVDHMNQNMVHTEQTDDQTELLPDNTEENTRASLQDTLATSLVNERGAQLKQVTLFLVDKLFLATPHIKVPPCDINEVPKDDGSAQSDASKGAGLSIQEVVNIHEAGFTVKIQAPGTETFDLQISGQMLVAELHQVLMDHEMTCQRTCFSLQLGGAVLDSLSELRSIQGLQEGELIKVVEDSYTVRDVRLHLKHVRNLLRSLDPTDAQNGVNGSSLSYLSLYVNGDAENQSGGRRRASERDSVDPRPPDYILPGCKTLPLTPLQPMRDEWKPIQCLRVLTVSSWNPPPGNRKMHGDLMYLNVVTMEEKHLNVTSSTRGFYLNQSTAFTFNPKPAFPKILCHSLVELLNQVSPAFRKNFSALQKMRVLRHPYERIATPFQLYTWTAPHGDHTLDCVRAEETHTSRMGQDEHTAGQGRDWNEELQGCRELPRRNLQERLQRERSLFKTNSDFVAAATQGAMAVVDGNVMPLNPGEEHRMQMFICNSLFFSLAFDTSDNFRLLGGNAAAHAAAGSDLRGVEAYAAVDTEGLHTLGTAVVDYRGYRVTAQTIVPGILEKNQEQNVVYGSNDFGKTVLSHPSFIQLLEKSSGPLRIQRHKVLDHTDLPVELCSSVETKGIMGNDGRPYILDLLRTFPPDLNFVLSDEEVQQREFGIFVFPRRHQHSLASLRPELIEAFVQHRYEAFLRMVSLGLRQGPEKQEKPADCLGVEPQEEPIKTLETEDADTPGDDMDFQREVMMKACDAVGSVKDSCFDIRFIPDVFSSGVRFPPECSEDVQKQKELLLDAASFILSNQIPAVLRDCLDQTAVPMDGASLAVALHQRGVNIRYLGTMLKLLERAEERARLSHIQRIGISEVIVRSAKHIFRTYLQEVEPAAFSSAVSHFLNCLLGSASSFPDSTSDELLSRRRGRRRRSHGNRASMQTDSVWARLTPGDLWLKIRTEAEDYYYYTFHSDCIDEVIERSDLRKLSLLREMTLKTGIQVQLREYCFDSRHRPVFSEEDVVNMFPVVKCLRPTASDATLLIQQAQVAVQQGQLNDGYELISQAQTLFSSVCGVMHEDVSMCLRLLGRLSYILGEYTNALNYQEKATITSERVMGVDHPQTIQDYTYLALYCFAAGQLSSSLQLLYRARYLTLLVSGEDHPQVALLDSMIGLMLHGLQEYELSLKFLQNALTLTSTYHGAASLKHAHSYHLLASLYESKGEFRLALQHEREAYSIYKSQVGEHHESTKESSQYLRRLTQQAVLLQKAINSIYGTTPKASMSLPKFSTPSVPMILQQLNLTCGIILIPLSAKDVADLRNEMKGKGRTQVEELEKTLNIKEPRSVDD